MAAFDDDQMLPGTALITRTNALSRCAASFAGGAVEVPLSVLVVTCCESASPLS